MESLDAVDESLGVTQRKVKLRDAHSNLSCFFCVPLAADLTEATCKATRDAGLL